MEDNLNKTPKKRTGKIIGIILLLLSGYGIYSLVSFFSAPSHDIQQIYLIPKDAVFIIQSNNPVDDWRQFSRSKPWQTLKGAPSFADIAGKAETLDSILRANEKLMSYVGKRDLMISAHKVRAGFWDFLYVLDLQKISELNVLKERIGQIYSQLDFKVTSRKYKDVEITELKNKETQEILYTAFLDNHYVASYSSSLVEASIRERLEPSIGLNPYFIEATKQVANKGLYRVYVQYAYLPQFMSIYLGESNPYLNAVSSSMSFAGMNFQATDDKFELKGHTFINDTIDAYVAAFLHSGKQEIKAQSILSDRTAFYTHIGFDNPATFLKELEKALSTDPSFYNDYQKNYKRIESWLDLSLAGDFLGWMSGEFAVTESEPGLLGNENETILAVRAKDIQLAKEKMAFIEKKVKKRTPINIKSVAYKGYDIQYIELKGVFKLFFGKMLDKFEKPYYTYMEDYVVFSNRPSSLLSLIEDYEQGRILKNEEGFQQVYRQVEKNASYFVYMNTPKFFQMLKPVLNTQTWANVNAHKEIACSFPYPAFQVIGGSSSAAVQLTLNYSPWTEEVATIDEPDDNDDDGNADEISELNRFYAEKFQGNVYREFYPEGALKSESEIKNGKRHGKYREYYETGKLYIRGKYKKGVPDGTWKYYTQEGRLERKEKN